MPDISQPTWSEIDSANDAPTPNGWPEGQPPSSVNDCARMMMGAIKRWFVRHNGTVLSTGAADAYTVSYASAPAAYADGETYAFKAHQANAGPASFGVAPLAQKPLRKPGPAGLADLAANDIVAGQRAVVQYDAAADLFVLCSPVANAVSLDGAGKLPALDGSQLTGVLPTGTVVPYAGAAAPAGWLLCDGAAVVRTDYAALFAVIGTTFGAGDGTSTFNLPDLRGRTPVGAGSGRYVQTVPASAVDTATNQLAVAINDSFFTGAPVVLATSGIMPGGLTVGETYYAIRVSPNAIKLAVSLANAIDGTPVDLTSQGSGNHTLVITYSARAIGTVGGEETHANTIGEMPAHSHSHKFNVNGAVGSAAATPTDGDGSLSTARTGGSQAHNNMPPYIVMNYVIKA